MDKNEASKVIGEVFNEIAENIKSESFVKKLNIGLTILGSEHSIEEMIKAGEMAEKKYDDFEVVLIGSKNSSHLKTIEANSLDEAHEIMIKLLDEKKIDGCVTRHFDFPIGVSTIGKIITPGRGKEMLIASTTGTSSANKVEAMVLNAIAGIAAAKVVGIMSPKVGILNLEGARKTEKILKELKAKGYDIEFQNSIRADGGAVMRGNDLLYGSPDVMVCDSLTGNLLVKIFSSFTTGGNYETLGAGYGPGIGEGYNRLINIVSRASGAPLVCEALKYCALCAKNKILNLVELELNKAKSAGLKDILVQNVKENISKTEEIEMPPKKVVTFSILGIDILELENACKALWKEGIYSESGMGCTGPIILVAEDEGEKAKRILKNAGY